MRDVYNGLGVYVCARSLVDVEDVPTDGKFGDRTSTWEQPQSDNFVPGYLVLEYSIFNIVHIRY